MRPILRILLLTNLGRLPPPSSICPTPAIVRRTPVFRPFSSPICAAPTETFVDRSSLFQPTPPLRVSSSFFLTLFFAFCVFSALHFVFVLDLSGVSFLLINLLIFTLFLYPLSSFYVFPLLHFVFCLHFRIRYVCPLYLFCISFPSLSSFSRYLLFHALYILLVVFASFVAYICIFFLSDSFVFFVSVLLLLVPSDSFSCFDLCTWSPGPT